MSRHRVQRLDFPSATSQDYIANVVADWL